MEFELTEDFLEQLKNAVVSRKILYIQDQMNELLAPDISIILHELDMHEAKYILQLLDKEFSAEIIRELDEDFRKKFLKDFSSEEIADYIEFIDSDDAVDILNEQPVRIREEVIDLLEDETKANHIKDLLHYDEDCAGGLMAKELLKTNLNWTIDQCIEEIRRQTKNVEKIYSIYVVDNQDKLLGRVSLKKMLLADDNALIADVYDSDIISVESYRDAKEVAEIMKRYDLVSIPVVNVHGKLLGRITIDDIVDVITEQAELDIQMMAGISNPIEEDDDIWTLSKARLPWLLIGMLGGILGAKFIGLFEADIALIPAMAFFIPLITATGGNVGIQSSSVIVQTLAKETSPTLLTFDRFFKGLLVALINGIVISGVVFLINFLIGEATTLSIVVSTALFCVVMLSSLMGTITPILLSRFGVNPALASGPFITTANDLLGLGIYFSVAHLLYSNL
ncbi:MAG: magnesium transporter [Cytophagales bacterium]|nr:MAG: magnesium transporter [Cytophagales bacterium]